MLRGGDDAPLLEGALLGDASRLPCRFEVFGAERVAAALLSAEEAAAAKAAAEAGGQCAANMGVRMVLDVAHNPDASTRWLAKSHTATCAKFVREF